MSRVIQSMDRPPTDLIPGWKLARLLGVAPANVSLCVKNEWHCSGYDVTDWVVRNEHGRVLGFILPRWFPASVSAQDRFEKERNDPFHYRDRVLENLESIRADIADIRKEIGDVYDRVIEWDEDGSILEESEIRDDIRLATQNMKLFLERISKKVDIDFEAG